MKRLLVALYIVSLSSLPIVAETTVEIADRMHDEEQHLEVIKMLEGAIDSTSGSEILAELYWRLARATMEIGDLMELEGASERALLDKFLEGEGYADKAVELDSDNYEAYYWKSANLGRWGEVKGILNSLFKVKPMRNLLIKVLSIYPEHRASFYVLGIMYERVPGRPISFGNSNYSVSLGRKAVDANRAEIKGGMEDEVKLVFHIELARHLKDRGWSASKRRREHDDNAEDFRNETGSFKKNRYYEGTLDIPNVSDEEEAIQLMKWVIGEYEKLDPPRARQLTELEEAREDLAKWTD